MLRIAKSILIIVVLAALVNLLVAWLIAWRIYSERIVVEAGPYVRQMNSDGTKWEGYLQKGLLTTRLQISLGKAPAKPQNSGTGGIGDMKNFIADIPAPLRTELLRWRESLDPPKARSQCLKVIARGWPVASFYLVEDQLASFWKTQPRDNIDVHGAWNIRPATRQQPTANELPFLPIWPGFLINMLVYVPLVSLLVINVGAFRQLKRYRRGCCPVCSYDLRANFANGCSECGWRRATVTGVESKAG